MHSDERPHQEQSSPASTPTNTTPERTPEIVLRTRGLTKVYGEHTAVDHLSIDVRRGEVFGLLGPNGAGKTTTIRMILNLIRPTEGQIFLFGQDLARHAVDVLPRVGALIDMPAFYGFLSGRHNLDIVAGLTSGVPSGRISEVLALVGLAERGRDRYATYSLGMRQRLGVAAALLADPELLILDEPANDLDPIGIVEMRRLIQTLASQGKTIFFSSHIPAEVRHVCDRVAVVRDGSQLVVSAVADLLRDGGRYEIEVDDLARATAALQSSPDVQQIWNESNQLIVQAPASCGRELNRRLAEAGCYADSLRRQDDDLEAIFRNLTESAR